MSEAFRWKTVDDGEPALFGVDELLAPVRGTGRMSDLEFLHVTTKRILNRVPPGSRAPTNWTINVYRGCSHACAYCLSGDTPVLLADGRTKALRDVRAGDRVYGTERRGAYRRYVPTDVLDHWQTVTSAYRVSLEDGTELIASGDHRFLTGRGWKYVAPARRPLQRAALTVNDELLGVGHLATAPQHDDDYRRGYLTGIVRGDAGRAPGDVHRFRLALADGEPLDRTRAFLDVSGVPTTTVVCSEASANRRAMTAISASSRAAVQQIPALIAWPVAPTDTWRKGFLAGLFDAAGSHSHGVLRIATSDPTMLEPTVGCAETFGFHAVPEPPRANGVRCVRIAGGLRERLRFLLSIDPAMTRSRILDGMAITSDAALRVTAVEPLGIDIPMYDITTGTGDFIANGVVSHNCFARPTHAYLGLGIGEDFDRKIVVKINAVERLRAELADPRWTNEPVAMGTNTDPYQRAEAKYRLTRGVVEALSERGTPFSILTKSPLVTRDLDLIVAASQRADVRVDFSIGTLDQRVWRASEPGSPNPRLRVEAMRRLAERGVHTGALIAPVLPGMSDSPEQLQAVVAAVRDAGGEVHGLGPLYLKPGTREHFLTWLAGHDPALHADYLRRYAGGDYAPERYLALLYARAGLARRHRSRNRDRM